ncbi:MMPL family transporter [Nocardia sp. NPDC006044]|uniref:MMPL family transporter n=1 Tax=Nocardia sp. NPDC006044 TaxID=3364306 RepID=UPI00369652B6
MLMAVHRRRVLVGWLLAVLVGVLGLPHLLGSMVSPSLEVTGSESQVAGRVLAAGLPTFGNDLMIGVLHSPSLAATDPVFRTAADSAMTALGRQDGIAGIVQLSMTADSDPASSLAQSMAPLRALFHDEHTVYLLIGATGDDRERQARTPAQQDALARAAQANSAGQVQAYLVGVPAFGQILQQTEIADLVRIEMVAVPVAILVLLFGLRAPVAALVPVVIAGAATISTLGLFAVLTGLLRVDGMLLIGVNAIGLGIGIDYALFVMYRYREELAAGAGPEKAIATAAATSGRTVLYSGLILLLASVSLFLLRWPVFIEAAIGVIAVVTVTAVAAVTLLPAVLSALSDRIEWQPRWLSSRTRSAGGAMADQGGLLARWAGHLMRHPWPYAIGVSAALLFAATPVPSMHLGLDVERRALSGTAYFTGFDRMTREVPGFASTIAVLVERPADTDAPATGALVAALQADPEVAGVSVIDNDSDLTALLVVPRHPPDSPAAVDLVQRIRTHIVRTAGPPGFSVLVGGSGALVADILIETSAKLWWVIGCVLMLLFAALIVMLRSVLLPLKALLMSLLATGAAFGLSVLVFQRDRSDGALLDLAVPGSVWPQVPLVVFVVLFGLSTDYELFLVRRIQEEYRMTGDNRRAVSVGLQQTARPITLAAAILVVGFGSLLMSRISGLEELGFAVAVALIIDATVVRLVLVPALMQIMGRWNWWLPACPFSIQARKEVR